VRRDICAESTGDFQDTLVIHSAGESDHKACHERIAGADGVFHFYMRGIRGCSDRKTESTAAASASQRSTLNQELSPTE
jgi:hypothetical protein